MMVSVNFLGQTGLIKDREPYDLGPEFFTSCLNVSFEDGEVKSNYNWQPLLSLAAFSAYGLFHAKYLTTNYWVMTGLAAVKSITGATVADITRSVGGAYTGGGTHFWNGGMFNDILILNNGIDVPQSWNLPAGTALLTNLPNWPATTRAKIVRPFKNVLVALNVLKVAARDDRLVKWSHTAAPLTIPSSWDETDATLDAGEATLSEGEDAIVDGLSVGNQFAIGTNSQTWAMRFVGGQDVFAFQKVFGEVGLLTQNVWTSFLGRIFQITADDFVVHDLVSLESVATGAVKRWFFSQLTTSNYEYVRVVRKVSAKEIWIMMPGSGVTYLTSALVWNWHYNTWSIRDLPATDAVASGYSSQAGVTDNFKDRIGNVTRVPYLEENAGHITGGVNKTTSIERIGLAIKAGADGKPAIDHNTIAVLKEFWPKFVAEIGEVFTISIGFQLHRDDTITWEPSVSFTIGTDHKIGVFGSYRYLSYKIVKDFTVLGNAYEWKFIGFDLDLDMSGAF